MKQAAMVNPGDIAFHQMPRPTPGDNQVLIEVKRIGVCGSNGRAYQGMHPSTDDPVVDLGLVQDRELSLLGNPS